MGDFDTSEIDGLNSKELLKLFNEFLYDLLKQLNSIVKNDEDISYFYNVFNDVAKMQQTLVIDQFIIHVLQYYDQIKQKNADFFIKENIESKYDGSIVSKFFKFKKLFKELSKKEKEMLFYYLNILCYISARYFTLTQK
jgi:hypothetical protein|uniref:Uncharacterized protein n=1 Tax=viral metagenome TaxID=1070528 RepID=A0A6C0H0I5_9ZZZZ